MGAIVFPIPPAPRLVTTEGPRKPSARAMQKAVRPQEGRTGAAQRHPTSAEDGLRSAEREQRPRENACRQRSTIRTLRKTVIVLQFTVSSLRSKFSPKLACT